MADLRFDEHIWVSHAEAKMLRKFRELKMKPETVTLIPILELIYDTRIQYEGVPDLTDDDRLEDPPESNETCLFDTDLKDWIPAQRLLS